MEALANNFQVLFQGLALGSIYALVALGFVLIIRTTNVVNFAQGDFAMLGGYAMVMFLVGMPGNPDLGLPGMEMHLPYWLAILLTLVVMAVIGVLFNFGVYYPLRNRPFLPVLISTLGASIFLQNTILALFNPQPRPLDKLIDVDGVTIGGVFLDSQYLVILVFTIAAVAFQYFLFEHTLLGKKLQAVSQDKDMARLLGIPVTLMIIITFVYSAALGGLAGRAGVADPVRVHRPGLGHRVEGVCRHHHRRLRRHRRRHRRRLDHRGDRELRGLLHLGALQGRLRVHLPVPGPAVPAAGHLRRESVGESMSAGGPHHPRRLHAPPAGCPGSR